MDDEHLTATLQSIDERHESLRTWLERSEREFIDSLQTVDRRRREADRLLQEQLDEHAEKLAEADRRYQQQLTAEAEKRAQADRLHQQQLEERARKWAESDRLFWERLEEDNRKWAESDRQFRERLDLYDQRDVAFVRRMERLRDEHELLAGQSGQVAEDLVEHKRDPDAHG